MSLNQLVKPEHLGAFSDALFDVLGAKIRGESVDSGKAEKVTAVLQNFWELPNKKAEYVEKARLQAFMTKSDLPDIITNMPDIFRNVDNFDSGWMLAFKDRALDPGRKEWELVTFTNGITWRLMGEGERAVVEGITGDVRYGSCNRYSAAVGWTYDMINYRRLGSMVELALEVRNSYFEDKANRHYGLLRQSKTGTTTNYDTTGSTQLDKDINTLNSAIVTMSNQLKDKSYGDVVNATYLLYIKPHLKARMIRALANTAQDVQGMPQRVIYNIQPVVTWNANAFPENTTTDALLVLPGQKIQKATALDMLTLGDTDNLSATYTQAFHSFYGAVVGDGEQLGAVKFA